MKRMIFLTAVAADKAGVAYNHLDLIIIEKLWLETNSKESFVEEVEKYAKSCIYS